MPLHFVGTAGFASPNFRSSLTTGGAAATDLLASYATRFSAVEMDSSFARPPGEITVRGWLRVAGDLMFTVRMAREVSHVQRLERPEAAASFVATLAPLGRRLGCVLVTVPANLDCDVGRVRRVLDAVPEDVRTAWEFRHPSWACPEVIDLLVERGATPVIVETLDGVTGGELLPGGYLAGKWDLPFLYVRLRRERYTARELMVWGQTLGQAVATGRPVFAFFKASPEASAYATALDELLTEVPVRAGADR